MKVHLLNPLISKHSMFLDTIVVTRISDF